MLTILAVQAGNPLGFVLSFLVFIIVAAIVILAVRWLLGIMGIAANHPAAIILYLVLLLFLICGFWYWGGSYGAPWHR
jgi:hypothetical protein